MTKSEEEEYNYLFRNGTWFVESSYIESQVPGADGFHVLTEDLCELNE